MNEKTKRRWYQFRLRTLFVTTAVVGMMLSVCGRISYLRQRVQFHDQEATRCAQLSFEIHTRHGSPKSDASPEEMYGPDDGARSRELTVQYSRHLYLGNEYHAAVFRPWTIVDETATPPWMLDPSASELPNLSAPDPNPPKE